MGRVSDMVIGLEELWYEKADYWAGSCEHFAEFQYQMAVHRDKMTHYTDQEYDEILSEAWQEKWSKYP